MKTIFTSIIIFTLVIANSNAELSQDDNSLQCPNSFVVVKKLSANNFTQDNATLRYQGQPYILPPNVYLMPTTSLMWQACPLGYTTNREQHQCDVNSTTEKNWSEAHQSANAQNVTTEAGLTHWHYSDWRVPNVKELTSLFIHPACRVMDRQSLSTGTSTVNGGTLTHSLPVIDNDDNHWYWSSSPVLQKLPENNDKAWAVNLDTGEVAIKTKTEHFKVILVRSRTFE